MRVKLDPGAFPPLRMHPTDAGLDIRAMNGGLVRAGQSAVFRSGIHIELPKNTAGLFVAKSGLMINHDITATGLVDEGYDGEIMVKLFNHGLEDYSIRAGDKIGQLVIMPVLYEPIEVVDSIKGGARGSAGFGSSGR